MVENGPDSDENETNSDENETHSDKEKRGELRRKFSSFFVQPRRSL